jgi:hypothetical protein
VVLKVRTEKNCPLASLERLARICSELGVQYFSIPYFAGCERLQAECSRGCLLEVSGIDSLPIFKEMAGAGMGRMMVKRAWELYSEWLKEVEQIVVEKVEQTPPAPIEDTMKKEDEKEEEKEKEEKDLPPKLPMLPLQTPPVSNPQTNYRCHMEGSDLKFL